MTASLQSQTSENKGSYLLVPLRLDAWVVHKKNQANTLAKMAVDYASTGENTFPKPFDTRGKNKKLPLGVHLHWILPEAFRRGQVNPKTGEHEYRPIPNRWLIARTRFPDELGDKKPAVTCWILESDSQSKAPGNKNHLIAYPDVTEKDQENQANLHSQQDQQQKRIYLGKKFESDVWSETNPNAKPFLTAMAPGDPSFTATYINNLNILAFYDDLTNEPNGKYSYTIAGWFNLASSDPLHEGKGKDFKSLMDQLAWSTSSETPSKNAANPKRTLCHGSIFDIAWQKEGPEDYQKPHLAGDTLKIALGHSAFEALAALMTSDSDLSEKQTFENVLMALQKKKISQLVQDPFDFQADARKVQFSPSDADVHWKIVPKKDPEQSKVTEVGPAPLEKLKTRLADINGLQEKKDRLTRLQHSQQAHWFALQWKLAILQEEQESLKAQNKSTVDELKPEIEKRADQLKTEIEKRKSQIHKLEEEIEKQRGTLETDCKNADFELLESAAQPFFQPVDPVVLITGAGMDENYAINEESLINGKLLTRYSDKTISKLSGKLKGEDIELDQTVSSEDLQKVFPLPQNVSIPPKCLDLIVEGLFLDTNTASYLTIIGAMKHEDKTLDRSDILGFRYGNDPIDTDCFFFDEFTKKERDKLSEQLTLIQKSLWEEEGGFNPAIRKDISGFNGILPAPLAVNWWKETWSPLFLDWELDWYAFGDQIKDSLNDWSVATLDFSLRPETDFHTQPPQTINARVLLNGKLPLALHHVLAEMGKYLEEHGTLLDEEDAKAIKSVVDQANNLKLVAQRLMGFQETMLMRCHQSGFENMPEDWQEIVGDSHTFIPKPGTEDKPLGFFPIRGGFAKIKKLRLIDAYGQFVDCPQESFQLSLNTAQSLAPPQEKKGSFLLRPRLSQGTRLRFNYGEMGKNADSSALAGWLVSNHLDDSIAVFDAVGGYLGEMAATRDGDVDGAVWEPELQSNAPLGGLPKLENPHLNKVVQGILAKPDKTPHRLRQLLSVIDVSLANFGVGEHPSRGNLDVILGAPIAVIRAHFFWELDGLPVCNQSWEDSGKNITDSFEEVPFPFKIGDLRHQRNGIIGYFLNDNYQIFYASAAYREKLAAQSKKGRKEKTDQVKTGGVESFVKTDKVLTLAPLQTADPSVNDTLSSTKVAVLTLLVDPRGQIPLITPINPVQLVPAPPHEWLAGLKKMAFPIRTGPLLLPPEQIQIPKPAQISGDWSWISRSGVTTWEPETPIKPQDPKPVFPLTPPEIHDGWLKLKPQS